MDSRYFYSYSAEELNDMAVRIKHDWMNTNLSSGCSIDQDNVIEDGVEWLYSLKGRSRPEIVFVDNPTRIPSEEKKTQKNSGLKDGAWVVLHYHCYADHIFPVIESGLQHQIRKARQEGLFSGLLDEVEIVGKKKKRKRLEKAIQAIGN